MCPSLCSLRSFHRDPLSTSVTPGLCHLRVLTRGWPTMAMCQIWPAACFWMSWELRMAFTFSNVEKEFKEESCFVTGENEMKLTLWWLWSFTGSQPHYLFMYSLRYFCTSVVDLSIWDGDCIACKAENVYSLDHYRKCLLIPGLKWCCAFWLNILPSTHHWF